MSAAHRKSISKGFTLIELLVVISIIALLAAILFPVFARARENARRTSCQSNLKQISLGFLMYTQDYDGRMPYYPYDADESPGVMGKVFPYVKSEQLFICPSSNLTPPASTGMKSYYSSTYGLPAVYDVMGYTAALTNLAWGGSAVVIMDAIPEPAITAMIAETSYQPPNTLKYGFDRFSALDLDDTGFNGVTVLDRHFEGSNFAYMDGHVKWLKQSAVRVPHAQNTSIKFYWPKS